MLATAQHFLTVILGRLNRQEKHTVTLNETLGQANLELLTGNGNRITLADKKGHHLVEEDTRVAFGNRDKVIPLFLDDREIF